MKLLIFLCLSVVSAKIPADSVGSGGRVYLPSNFDIPNHHNTLSASMLPRARSQSSINGELNIGYQLVIAAKAGNVRSVEQLLQYAPDADKSFRVPKYPKTLTQQHQLTVGTTPMIEACRGGHVRIVEILLAANPDLTIADSNGDTATSLATDYARVEILALFKIYTRDELAAPLIQAASNGDDKFVEKWLNDNPHADPNRSFWGGNTALITAARFGQVRVVKLLVGRQGINIDAINKDGKTALWQACRYGHKGAVEILLSVGAGHINSRNGVSPMEIAQLLGHDEVVELFFKKHG